jgi:hypothetical protein
MKRLVAALLIILALSFCIAKALAMENTQETSPQDITATNILSCNI